MDLKSAAFKGGETFAPAIIPGKSADSPLVRFVAGLGRSLNRWICLLDVGVFLFLAVVIPIMGIGMDVGAVAAARLALQAALPVVGVLELMVTMRSSA